MSKAKRRVHAHEQEWNWWVSYDRYKEPHRVTICSPDKKYYIHSPEEILGKPCFYYGEPGYRSPIQITPSDIKSFIDKNILNPHTP